MEIIHKTINLEDFKNRFLKSFGTEWGKVILHDYLVDSGSTLYEIKDNIPLSYEKPFEEIDADNEKNRFRFGNIILLKSLVNKTIEGSTFYKACRRGEEHIWVEVNSEEYLDTLIDILPELPSAEDYDIGDILWITVEAENIKRIFFIENEEIECGIQRIFDFISFFDESKENSGTTVIGDAYFELNVMLTENCNDFGVYTKLTEPKYIIEKREPVAIFTESRLFQVMRHKKSYDDNGNELPFIVSEESENSLGIIEGSAIPYYAGTGYITGVSYNVYVNEEGVVCGDYVSNIEVAVDAGVIRFTYVIGAEILSNNTYNGGISYREEYKLGEEETFEFMYENSALTATFRRILYDEQPDEYKEEEGYEDGKRYAFAAFVSEFKTESSDTLYVKEESLMNIDDISIKDDKPRVERGTSAAFEMHNILGECRTMDDLEKYRNDFFTIKDDEKQ